MSQPTNPPSPKRADDYLKDFQYAVQDVSVTQTYKTELRQELGKSLHQAIQEIVERVIDSPVYVGKLDKYDAVANQRHEQRTRAHQELNTFFGAEEILVSRQVIKKKLEAHVVTIRPSRDTPRQRVIYWEDVESIFEQLATHKPITIQDVVQGTPAGQEAVQRAMEASAEAMEKARATHKPEEPKQ